MISCIVEKYRATVDYTDSPTPGGGKKPLRFKRNDTITVLTREGQWWKGTVDGTEGGWFPAQFVEEAKVGTKLNSVTVQLACQ